MTIQVPIPGLNPGDPEGTATLREPHEVTERHRRPIKLLMMRLNPTRFASLMDADDDELPDIEFTESEALSFVGLADHTIHAALVEWTLDLPIPATVEDVIDLPGHLYDALEKVTAGIGQALTATPGADVQVQQTPEGVTTVPVDSFTLAGVEDKASPTGASDA